jgi:hypothetical protein
MAKLCVALCVSAWVNSTAESFSAMSRQRAAKYCSVARNPRRRNLGSCRSTCLIATARHVVAEACSASKLAADAIQQSTLHARHREIDLWHRGAM